MIVPGLIGALTYDKQKKTATEVAVQVFRRAGM